MLEHGVVTLATSPWASNVVFVTHPPLKFCVDYRRLTGISSQEQYDAHANSVKVAALSHGTESQLVVRYDREGVATLLYNRLPSVAAMGVGDAVPVQLDSPTVHTVTAVIKGEEDIFGLAGGSLAEEWMIDKKRGALVAMWVSPNSDAVQNEAELTEKLSWDGLIATDGVVRRKKVKFKSRDATSRTKGESCDHIMQLLLSTCVVNIAIELCYAGSMGGHFDMQCTRYYSGTLFAAVINAVRHAPDVLGKCVSRQLRHFMIWKLGYSQVQIVAASMTIWV